MDNNRTKSGYSTFFKTKLAYILFIYLFTLLLIMVSKLISPNFGSWAQIESILVISSLMAMVGFAHGMVILVGELDLSVGAIISLAGVYTAAFLGVDPTLMDFVVLLLLLMVIGAFNGIGVTYLKVPSFIMTLGTQMILFGCALGYTKGTVPGTSPAFLEKLMSGRLLEIPIPIFILIGMMIFGTYFQIKSNFGRKLYSIGSNKTTAHLAGVSVNKTIILAYMMSALFSGITGMMLVGYSGGATLEMGNPYLIPSIAMVVIGGSSILGGSGNYLGTVGAAIFLTTVSTLIQAIGINQGWQTFINGLMILLVLSFFRKEFYQLFKRINVSIPNNLPDKKVNAIEKAE